MDVKNRRIRNQGDFKMESVNCSNLTPGRYTVSITVVTLACARQFLENVLETLDRNIFLSFPCLNIFDKKKTNKNGYVNYYETKQTFYKNER